MAKRNPSRTATTLEQLSADPNNRRVHTPRNLEMIATALKTVGAARSIVIDEQNAVLAGNGVVLAAADAGLSKLKIVDVDGDTIVAVRRSGLTEEQKTALAIYDNRTAELATWNAEQLAADLKAGVDLAPFFFEGELKTLVAAVGRQPGLTDPDEVPAARPTSIVAGDLFELGAHRLLCGDSTKPDDVARLMGNLRADIAFTSPPYGAGNVAKLRDHYVKGREARESFYVGHDAPGEWLSLMAGWFAAVRPVVDAVLVNVQMLADNKRAMVEWLYAYRADLCDVIVWDKVHAAPQMQRNVLSNAFEFVFVLGGNGTRAIPFGDFHGSLLNIVHINPKGTNEYAGVHRAVMPIELPIWVLMHLCPRAATVVDPFAGTGTTLIAAEQSMRRCFAIELAATYCQVIIDRWEAFTGLKATKVGEAAIRRPRRGRTPKPSRQKGASGRRPASRRRRAS